jgi:ureidoacrylate peracid hydrolase
MSGPLEKIEVPARPVAFGLDPRATAVVVVDMQNDFASPGGMFDRAGIDITGVQAIVTRVAAVLGAARDAGLSIVYLKMGFQPDLADAGCPTSPTWLKHVPLEVGAEMTSPDGAPSRVLIRDCWNTDIVSELAPEPDDVVLYKTRYSGFFGTELDDVLRRNGVERLIVMGATTSVCVDSTVRDAMFRDYHCLVVSDATAEPIAADASRSNHEASLLILELLFAQIATSADVVSALRAAASLPGRTRLRSGE